MVWMVAAGSSALVGAGGDPGIPSAAAQVATLVSKHTALQGGYIEQLVDSMTLEDQTKAFRYDRTPLQVAAQCSQCIGPRCWGRSILEKQVGDMGVDDHGHVDDFAPVVAALSKDELVRLAEHLLSYLPKVCRPKLQCPPLHV